MSAFNVFFHVLFIRAGAVGAWFISLCVTCSDSSMKPKCGIFRINTRGICLLVSLDLHVYLCKLFFQEQANSSFELCLEMHPWGCHFKNIICVLESAPAQGWTQHLPGFSPKHRVSPEQCEQAAGACWWEIPVKGGGLLPRAGGVTGRRDCNPLEVKDGHSDTATSLWN